MCASFARKRFPTVWRRTKSFKRAASTARCCWTSKSRCSQNVSPYSRSRRLVSGEQRPLALARNLPPPAVPNNNSEKETVAHAKPFTRRLLVAATIFSLLVLAIFFTIRFSYQARARSPSRTPRTGGPGPRRASGLARRTFIIFAKGRYLPWTSALNTRGLK